MGSGAPTTMTQSIRKHLSSIKSKYYILKLFSCFQIYDKITLINMEAESIVASAHAGLAFHRAGERLELKAF